MDGRDKARLLGLFFWLYTGLNILIVALIGIAYLLIFGAAFSAAPHKANEPDPAIVMTFMLVVMAVILGITILIGIPKAIAGYGLRKEKSWARVWAIVASVMACMSVPIGTAIGVFGSFLSSATTVNVILTNWSRAARAFWAGQALLLRHRQIAGNSFSRFRSPRVSKGLTSDFVLRDRNPRASTSSCFPNSLPNRPPPDPPKSHYLDFFPFYGI